MNCLNPTSKNFSKLRQAFLAFGLPTDVICEKSFLSPDEVDVFPFGRPPVEIDILTRVKGVVFEEAYALAELIFVEGYHVGLLHLSHLKEAKRSAGRHKDLDD